MSQPHYTNPYRSHIGVRRSPQKKSAEGVKSHADADADATAVDDDGGSGGGGEAEDNDSRSSQLESTTRQRITTEDVIQNSNTHLREKVVRPRVEMSRTHINRSMLQLELIRAIHRQDAVDAAHLIAQGADVRKLDDNGECPMRVALQSRQESEFHWPIIKLLAEHGADCTTPDGNGATPLMIASKSGCLPVFAALFSNVTKRHLSVKNRKGENCLFYAVRSGSVDMVRFIASRMNPYGIQRQNVRGETVFHLASMYGYRIMLQHLRRHEGGRLDTLMKRNKRNWTTIHYAIFCGHILVLRQLLKWGVPDLSAEETNRLIRLGRERRESYLREGIPMASPEERDTLEHYLKQRRKMQAKKLELFGPREVQEKSTDQTQTRSGVGYARSKLRG